MKWSEHIVRVIEDWGVTVKYLASDNAKEMLATARCAGLSHVPCLSHIGQLFYEASMSAFDVSGFISKLHSLYSRSKTHAKIFRRARVNPALFDCPTHAKALAFLSTDRGWAATRNAVRNVQQLSSTLEMRHFQRRWRTSNNISTPLSLARPS